MSYRFTTPWRWKGTELGWVHISGMISPWWGETKGIGAEEACHFLSQGSDTVISQAELLRVSENYSNELLDAGLADEALEGHGLSRTGLIAPSEFEGTKIEINEGAVRESATEALEQSEGSQNLSRNAKNQTGQSKLSSDTIEFVREAEAELGISINQCTAIVDGTDIDLFVLGELSSIRDSQRDFEIVAAVYDESGDLISEESVVFLGANFGVFDTFKITAFGLLSPPARIRVFPRAFN